MSKVIGNKEVVEIKIVNAQTKSKHFTIQCKFDINEVTGLDRQITQEIEDEENEPAFSNLTVADV